MEQGSYRAEIIFQAESDEFVGHVLNVGPDFILFRGKSVQVLREDLAGQVTFYEKGVAARTDW